MKKSTNYRYIHFEHWAEIQEKCSFLGLVYWKTILRESHKYDLYQIYIEQYSYGIKVKKDL